mmetsp:Transcript_29697/g.62528  ORF Transcript_29697/g.62528 Transcript_29697/m.62528 type:complete len:81 (-) Transcript_29697:105-347(-)
MGFLVESGTTSAGRRRRSSRMKMGRAARLRDDGPRLEWKCDGENGGECGGEAVLIVLCNVVRLFLSQPAFVYLRLSHVGV